MKCTLDWMDKRGEERRERKMEEKDENEVNEESIEAKLKFVTNKEN